MFYAERPRAAGSVQIAPPSGVDLTKAADDASWGTTGGHAATTKQAVAEWTEAARHRDDVLLFEIVANGEPVGQIFLHDIEGNESLIGYHQLRERDRGRGTGTTALKLLVDYVREETNLERLVVITSGDNDRSRRIAEKNGFAFVGPPREDPTASCLELSVSRR